MPNNPSCIARQAMFVQCELLTHGSDCWLKKLRLSLVQCGCVDIWDKWWHLIQSGCFQIACHEVIQSDDDEKIERWEDICLRLACNTFVSKWKDEVLRIKAKRGEGLNKLRTYALFKTEWCFESYLQHIDNRAKRVLLSKFRIGTCPLRIETGRYESVGRSKGIKAEERVCLCCNRNEVEDEFHFLLQCELYHDLRDQFLNDVQASKKLFEFGKLNASRKPCTVCDVHDLFYNNRLLLFKSVMASQEKEVHIPLSNFVWYAFKRREQLLTRP